MVHHLCEGALVKHWCCPVPRHFPDCWECVVRPRHGTQASKNCGRAHASVCITMEMQETTKLQVVNTYLCCFAIGCIGPGDCNAWESQQCWPWGACTTHVQHQWFPRCDTQYMMQSATGLRGTKSIHFLQSSAVGHELHKISDKLTDRLTEAGHQAWTGSQHERGMLVTVVTKSRGSVLLAVHVQVTSSSGCHVSDCDDLATVCSNGMLPYPPRH